MYIAVSKQIAVYYWPVYAVHAVPCIEKEMQFLDIIIIIFVSLEKSGHTMTHQPLRKQDWKESQASPLTVIPVYPEMSKLYIHVGVYSLNRTIIIIIN